MQKRIAAFVDEDLEEIRQRRMREMLRMQKRISEPVVADLDAGSFDAFLSGNELVLVDFWAEWCGPCKSMHPVYEAVARGEMRAKFARVNVDSAQQIAARYGVQSIPTFVIFKNGKQVGRMTGAVGEAGLKLIVNRHAASQESGRR